MKDTSLLNELEIKVKILVENLRREREKNIFYGSAKSALISFLSGLRQKFNGKLNILNFNYL